MAGGNGTLLHVRAYEVKFLDGSDETFEASGFTVGIGVIALNKGANTVALLSLHNVMRIKPVFEGQ